jgi:hypothetical protein
VFVLLQLLLLKLVRHLTGDNSWWEPTALAEAARLLLWSCIGQYQLSISRLSNDTVQSVHLQRQQVVLFSCVCVAGTAAAVVLMYCCRRGELHAA